MNQIKILLIEDNPADARLIKESLRDALDNFHLEWKEGLFAGLAYLAKTDVDVILVDLNLPDSQGRETFTKINAKFPDKPIIVLTGLNDKELAYRVVREGAQDYLIKDEMDGALLDRCIRYSIERKKSEIALQKEQQRLTGIIRGTNAGTWEWNVQTGETIFNDRWAEIIGYTLDEISPVSIETWMKCAHPDDLKASDELLEKHFRGELDYYEFESRMKHKDGNWVWVLDRGKVISWTEDGKPLMMMGTHQNINERKLTEEALKISVDKFTSAFRCASYAITITQASDGKIIEVNDGFFAITGYAFKDVAGKTTVELNLWDDERDRIFVVSELSKGKAIAGQEFSFLKKSGELIVGLFSAEIIIIQNEKYVLSCIIDITERKRVEAKLREEEERYRILIENSHDIIYTLNPDGVFTFVSPGWTTLLGHQVTQVIGKSFQQFVHPDDIPKCLVFLQTVIEEGKRQAGIEYRVQHADGTWHWHKSNAVPLRDEAGMVVGFEGNASDITERKLAEETLRESEELFRSLVHNSSNLTVLTDAKGIVTYVSPQCEHVIGHSGEKFVGQMMPDIIHPDDVTRCLQAWEQFTHQGQELREFEYRIVDGQGAVRWISHSAKLTMIDGRILGMHNTIRDNTEHKQMELAIQEKEERLREVLENSLDASYKRNLLTNIYDYLSPVFARISGYTPDEMKTLPTETVLGLMHPDDRIEIERVIAKSMFDATGKGYNLEYRFKNKDGHYRWFQDQFTISRDASGQPLALIGSVSDITGRKHAEETLIKKSEDLARSNAELAQFAYVASHDLQEPLRMVTSYVQLLEKRYKGNLDPDADEFIGYAVEGAKRMKQLLRDLMDCSRVSTKYRPLLNVESETVLETALQNLKIILEETKGTVTHDPLPVIMADETQMVQLFQNLIGNGLKFHGPQPPLIHVSAKQEGTNWVFSFQDNGKGIDPQYFEKIFVIFQRLQGRDKYPGTGIGLAIAKKIVERHGGQIWVDSKPEKGATFYFTIPVDGIKDGRG